MKNKSTIKINWSLFKGDPKTISIILKIGVPQLLIMLIMSFGLMFLNNLVGSISEDKMNAWTLVMRIDQILTMIGYAFGNAAITLIGQNYGRNNLECVRQIYKTNVLLGLVFCAVMAIIYILVSRPLFSLFSSVPGVISSCVTQVQILSFTYLGAVVSYISISTFQATGKPFLAFVINFLRFFVFTIPFGFLFVLKYKMGIYGIYAAVGGGNILVLIIAFIWAHFYLKNLKFKQTIG